MNCTHVSEPLRIFCSLEYFSYQSMCLEFYLCAPELKIFESYIFHSIVITINRIICGMFLAFRSQFGGTALGQGSL